MLLGEEEEDSEENEEKNEEEIMSPNQGGSTEEAMVSMHATSSNPKLKTMKFQGQLGKRPVYALLDSGSTHSFVDPAVLQGIQCQIVKTAQHP